MTEKATVLGGSPAPFNAAVHFVDTRMAAGEGNRVAVVGDGVCATYADVADRVHCTAAALRALGVRMEDRVVLLLRDGLDFVATFWGAIRIGAVPIPLNTHLRAEEYAFILDDSRARVLVVSDVLLPTAAHVRSEARFLEHMVVAGEAARGPLALDALVACASSDAAAAPTTTDDTAFWLYTSGTTGAPKAAIHLHHDMLVCCDGFGRHIMQIRPDDRTLSVAKLFFAYGLGNALYFPFGVAASTVLDPHRFDVERTFALIERHRPTLFFAVPTAYAALLQMEDAASRFDLSSLRCCFSAGEPLAHSLYDRWRERFGVEILDGLGSTEMCHTYIANAPGRARPGSSGTVVPGYEVRIVDEHGAEVPDETIGTLLVRGDSACAGYWNRHERTKKTVMGEWLRTGDQYRRDADGYYWYAGRDDDMMRVSGMWVSPAEVESVLVEHEAVLEAGVVGVPGADALTRTVAFVVLSRGREADTAVEEALQGHVVARLASYKCPRRIVFTRQLPKTATGKIQRYKLREIAREWMGVDAGSPSGARHR